MQPVTAHQDAWDALIKELGFAFHCAVSPQFHRLPCDAEAFFNSLKPLPEDLQTRGEIVVGHEVKRWMDTELGIPPMKVQAESRLAQLIPPKGRKAIFQRLQQQLDWKLPRLAMPVWGQWLAGAILMFGFVIQFIWPFVGLPLFFGGTFITFQIEKRAWSFTYRRFDQWVKAIVERSWPSLELGQADDDRLRIVFAEMLEWNLKQDIDPRRPFPMVEL